MRNYSRLKDVKAIKLNVTFDLIKFWKRIFFFWGAILEDMTCPTGKI